jgi:hypothetical protein
MQENDIPKAEMTDKEKADCFCQLYRDQQDRFKHTRDIWFKIMLILWTFIVVAGYSIKKEINLCSFKDYAVFIGIYIIIGVCIWFIYYACYRKLLYDSLITDKWIGIQYRNEINKLTRITLSDQNGKEDILNKPYWEEGDRWKIPEALITFFLYTCVFFYLLFL